MTSTTIPYLDICKCLNGTMVKHWLLFTSKSKSQDNFKYICYYGSEQDIEQDAETYRQDGNKTFILPITCPWNTNMTFINDEYIQDDYKEKSGRIVSNLMGVLQQENINISGVQIEHGDNDVLFEGHPDRVQAITEFLSRKSKEDIV